MSAVVGGAVTIARAAELLNLTSWDVRKLAEAGTLPCDVPERGPWALSLKGVVEYAVRRGERNALEIGYELGKSGHPVTFAPV